MLKLNKSALFIIFIFTLFSLAFCQEPATKEVLPQDIERAIENAIKNIDTHKSIKEKALTARLEQGLKSAIEDWIGAAKKQKDSQIDKLIEQNWEYLSEFGPRIHYDYYLREYDYSISEPDIIQTSSLVTPYKGSIKINEIIYAEKDHYPAASNVREFFYTATTPLKVNFDYRQDRFVFVNVEKGDIALKQGWPEEVIRKVQSELLE